MNANNLIEQMVKLPDEEVLKLKEYCDKELNHRLYWLRKGMADMRTKASNAFVAGDEE